VFARRGYHAASVDEIAAEAGYTIGALYAHFGGKQDLFRELLHEHVATRMAEYAAGLSRSGAFEDRLRATADGWMTFADEQPDFFPLLMEYRAAAARDAELRPVVVDGIRGIREGITALVRDAAAEGGIPMDESTAKKLGVIVAALGVGLAIERGTTPGEIPAEVFGDALVLMLRGLDGGGGKR